mgnify:CR=1 FL=1
MRARAVSAYANNQVQTGIHASSPAGLIVLIYERVFDYLKKGKVALQNGENGIDSFVKAHDLIQQGLLACLDYQNGGEIAVNLKDIYEWSLRELIIARLEKSPEKIDMIINVLEPLAESWAALAEI